MPKFADLTKQNFNRLTVLERAKNRNGRVYWKCLCICGNITIVQGCSLTSKATQSCGCLHKECVKQINSTHCMSNTPEFHTWESIIKRCTNPNTIGWELYGGRGIKICESWRHDFIAFYNHIGTRPSKKHSIDRIDNDGDYEPGNVRWATKQEQANNRRTNHYVTLRGNTLTISEWAKFTNVKRTTIHQRLKYGWPPAKAIFQPVNHRSK